MCIDAKHVKEYVKVVATFVRIQCNNCSVQIEK